MLCRQLLPIFVCICSAPDIAARRGVRDSAAVVHKVALAVAAAWPALQESTRGVDSLGTAL